MENSGYSIQGMTIAITNMEKMLAFYSNVFDMSFEEKEMYNSKLYTSVWGGLNLLFCPAEIAQNTATQNRHQFDIIIPDIQKIIHLAKQYGGETMGDISEDTSSLSIGIYDPDKNSITFKQLK